jgi:uncharacterized repeat protein (TIGR01451 family)
VAGRRAVFNPVELDLSSAVANGQTLMVRFGLGEGTALGGAGWWIDAIRLYNDGGTGDPADDNVLLLDNAASGVGGATIGIFTRNDDSAALGFGGLALADVLDLPGVADSVAMDEEGANLYIGSSAAESITVYQREPGDGSLSETEVVTLTASIDPPISADSLQGLAAMRVSPDGEHLIASGAALDRLVVFRRLPFVGTLQPMQQLLDGQPADQPVEGGIKAVRSIAFSSDGQQVFTAASGGQLGVFDRRAPDPTFGFLEAVIDGQDDGFGATANGLLGARATALSADGRWVFVASSGQIASGQSGSLVVLERDPASTEPGRHLRFRQALRNNQAGVTGMDGALALSVFGHDIYVAAERSNSLAHFRQDPVSGAVSFLGSYADGGSISGLSGAADVLVAPGGDLVYAAGRFDHAVAIFSRDSDTGALSFLGEARNGVAGISGMLGANALAISTDGLQLYVAARESDSVVVLDRVDSSLVYRQTFFDGTDGAVLTSPTGIAVSREAAGSEHVLVTSLDAAAVTVLKRLTDPSQPSLQGRLRFQQSLVNGVQGVEALARPRGIVVDPGNDRVYVASDDDNALVILDRNTSPGGSQFGNLTPLEVRRLGVRGVIGLNRPYGLAVSSGARRNIYAASLGGQSLAAFVRRSGSSCPAAGAGNLSEPVFIAAGGTVRFTITGTINPGAEGELDNTATLIVGDDVTNTGSSDSASSETKTLVPSSALSIEKSNNRLSVVAGQRQRYQIVVGNQGPSHARDVAITDILPPSQFDVDSAVWSCRAIGAGLLDRLESRTADGTGQDGLLGSAGVVATPAPHPLLSPRVYVAGVLGNGLAVFDVDPVSSELVPAPAFDLLEGGQDIDGETVLGLRGARALTASNDGRQLYLVSQVDNSILVIEVDDDDASPGFGGLRVRQTLNPQTPSAGLADFNQPTSVLISADQNQVYVAAANSDAIYVFDRLASGLLSLSQVVDNDSALQLDGVSSLLLGPEDRHLYAAGTNAGAVAVFARASDGTLTHMQTRSSPTTAGLAGVVNLTIDPEGAQLYAVARDDETIVVFNRDKDPDSAQFGRLLSGVAQRIERSAVPDLISPRAMVISPDGGSAYLAAFGRNALLVFQRDRDTGQLAFVTRYVDGDDQDGLGGVSSLVFGSNPDHPTLLVGALLDNSLSRFELAGFSRCNLDAGTGNVNLLTDIAAGGQILIDLEVDIAAGTEGQSCPPPLDADRKCVVNEAQASLTQGGLTTDYASSDASFLDRAANLIMTKTDGLAEFRGLTGAVAIDGSDVGESHVYVAAPGEPGIGVYAMEPVIGAPTGDYPLRFVEVVVSGENGVSQLNGISDVVVSPDGRHVYASSALDSAVVAFARDPMSGTLSVQAVYRNNNGGVSGMSGPRALAMDAAGRHLYVAARNANSVVVFARQHDEALAGFGNLSWQSALQNGTDGVQDMQAPTHLALSPDDRHVYVAAAGSDAVVVLRRQAQPSQSGFGELTWIQSRRNLIGNVVGLLGVSRVLVAPDGEFVYAAGTGNNAVVVFDRVSSSTATNFGRLSFVEAAVDGSAGFRGLSAVSDLTLLGPGGGLLAASSPTTSSVALIDRNAVTGQLAFLSLLSQGDVQEPGGSPVEVDGLAGARALFAMPGSERLYAGSSEPGGLAALDAVAGELAYQGSMIQGDGGAVPGSTVDYVITIYNEGPSRVTGARVTDIFPAEFDQVSWTCTFSSADSACPVSGVGNIDVDVTIAAGDTMRFFATGQLRSDADGFVVNRASVAMPSGVVDLDPTTSEATDDDTIVRSRSDLAIVIEDVPAELVAGDLLSYRLRVSNAGPSNARTARVEHRLPEALGQTAWLCEADREPGTLALLPAPVSVLSNTRTSAISGDGRHVYVTGDAGVPALAVYDRNTLDGNLVPKQLIENLSIQPHPDGNLLIDGLAGARALALTANDRFVYVLGYDDDAIAVFERDLVSGELTFLQVLRDNIGSVTGLGGPSALAMDANERQVYVAGALDDAIVVFDRDGDTGLLTYVQTRRNGQNGVQNLLGPIDLVLADGDATLLVASPQSSSLVRFNRAGDGLLSWGGSLSQGEVIDNGADSVVVDGLVGARSLALSPDGRWLYVYGRSAGDQVLGVFERASPTQTLPVRTLREGDLVGTPAQPIEGLIGASELAMTASGDQLYLAGLDDFQGQRSLLALRILEGADLQLLGRFEGAAAVAPGQAHRLSISADGRHLYGTGAGFDNLDIFALLGGSSCGRSGQVLVFDLVDLEAGGEVVYDITARVLSNARGPVELAASIAALISRQDPDLSNNIAAVNANIGAAAALEVIKTRQTDPVIAGEPVIWDISVTNNGPSALRAVDVYDALPTLPGSVANPMAAGVVAGSAEWLCQGSDHLATSQVLSDADLAGSRSAAISNDGLWAAVAAENSDSVLLYQRNPVTGGLVLVEVVSNEDPIFNEDDVEIGAVTGLKGAFDLAFSPDQRHLVVASTGDDALAVFALDAEAGSLLFIESRFNSDGDIVGLLDPVRLRFAPDGERLYVAARGSNALTVFSRQPVTGRLTWLRSWRSGLDGLPVNALDGIGDLVISPDGRFVYAAATENNGIGTFARSETGSLSWRGQLRNGQVQGAISVVGLGLVQSLAISPKGRHLYATSLSEDSVTLFDRDVDTGALSLAVQYRDGVGGLDALDGANGIVIGPEGENVLVSARNDQRITVFQRDPFDGHLRAIEVLSDPALGALRRPVLSPEGTSLLVTNDLGGGTLVNLRRQPEGYCGLVNSVADTLVDAIDLAPGGRVSYQVEALVHPGARGVLENTASVVEPAGTTPLTPLDQSDTDQASIEVVSDLRIVKTIDGESSALIGGGQVRFVLDMTNTGPSHAFSARLTDTLPASIVSASWTCQVIPADGQSQCPAAGSGDLDELVDIVVGERLLFIIDGEIASGFVGQLANTAEIAVAPDGTDPDLGNNVSSVSATVSAVADVSVSKQVSPTELVAGQTVTFTINVLNAGPSDAPSVAIVDELPAGLTDASWSCSATPPAVCPAASGSGDLIETVAMPAGGALEFVIEALVDPFLATPTTLVNQVSASLTGTQVTDPDTSNNQASASVLVSASEADLSVSKSVDLNSALPGDFLSYQIVLNNAGPSGSLSARLVDVMPSELINVSWTCQANGSASCPQASGNGDIDLELTLPPGSGLVIEVEAQIDPQVPSGPGQNVVNVVSVTAESGAEDPNPANNQAVAITVLDMDVIFQDRFAEPVFNPEGEP